MINRHGVLEAVERAATRDAETQGYAALVDMGLTDYAFEAVVLRHPEAFSETAELSRQRLADSTDSSGDS